MITLPSIEDVLSVTAPLSYEKRRTLYTPSSNGIFGVHSGIVRVFRLRDTGVSAHVDFYGPGQFFGLSCFDEVRNETAVAHSDCTVSRWPVEQLVAMAERGDVSRALLRMSVEQNARHFERLLRAERMSIPANLRLTLLDLAERIGTLEGDVATIEPMVTHHVLAEVVGTSRELITHHLNEFRNQGLVAFDRRAMVIYIDLLSAKKVQRAAA